MSQMLHPVRGVVRDGQWCVWISVWAIGRRLVSLGLDLERVWSRSGGLFFFPFRYVL